MITADERCQLEQVKTQVHCTKHFTCVHSTLNDLCQGTYHPDLDLLECHEKSDPPCKFARPFGCTHICTCPLRKYIARNFDRWSAESTALLLPPPSPPALTIRQHHLRPI